MKDQPDDTTKQADGQSKVDDGSIFDRVMPDGIKRGLEHLIRDGRFKHVLSELKMPKEIIPHIISQVDDTKKAAIQVISREVRIFLENTNLADELAKLLTQISFQVKTEVSFVPNKKAIAKKNEESTDETETDPAPDKTDQEAKPE
jgi:hypothetical protein